ncbi:MAG TPA: GntR family transcriptional regulator [Glaciibacter sp.]|nr:GntR family transcriptional regulator [Glaciibacter sp.]
MSKSPPVLTPFDANSPSLTERTIEAVREAIRTRALVPGELYSVYQLAAELGVSRSPVRDALLRLAETGMVRFERNRGFRVLVPGARELAEILAVRLALEVPAARRAARIAGIPDLARLRGEYGAMEEAASAGDEPLFLMHDQRLHALILELAGNSYVARVIDNLRDATRLVGASTIEHSRTLHDVQREHLPIIEAVEANDPERAALAMEHHLTETGRLLLREAVLRDGASVDVDRLWDDLVD